MQSKTSCFNLTLLRKNCDPLQPAVDRIFRCLVCGDAAAAGHAALQRLAAETQ